MPQCFCSSLGWFSAFVLKRLPCTLLTWLLLLLWMIILFKSKTAKTKQKKKEQERVLSTDLFICAHIGVRCGNTVIIIVVFILQPRSCWTTFVLLLLLLFCPFFLSLLLFSSSGEMSWNVRMHNGGAQREEGLLRGSSHFQFAVFCKRILVKNVKK